MFYETEAKLNKKTKKKQFGVNYIVLIIIQFY